MSTDIQPTNEGQSVPPQPDPTEVAPPNILEQEQAPEAMRRAMKKMSRGAPEAVFEMSAMMGMMGNPLHQKMTEAHITKMLDLTIQHDGNEFELQKTQQKNNDTQQHFERVFHLICFVAFIALVVFILWVFKDQPSVLIPILAGVGGIVTGFMGGMGYASINKKKSSSDD